MKSKILSWGVPLLIVTLIVGIVAVAIVKNSNQQKDDAVAVTVPVDFQSSGVVDGTNIGVIVTVGDSSAEGSEWNQAASGATVAAERFTRGNHTVNLITVDDHGTEDGAKAAVQQLEQKKVSGIVVASSGGHLQSALEESQQAGIPVILPYEEASAGAWSLALSSADYSRLVAKDSASSSQVFLINQNGMDASGIQAENTITYSPGDDANQVAQNIAQQTNSDDNKTKQFTVVINAHSSASATLLRAIQAAGVNAEIVLGSDATSPEFSKSLSSDSSGSLSIDARTYGYKFDDSVALQPDGQGRSMSSYLQAVQMMSSLTAYKSVLGDVDFKDVADSADSRSHDAVVSLVRAIEKADSQDPEKIMSALSTMQLSASDGITATGYDFSQKQTQNSDPVTLFPSTESLVSRIPDSTDQYHLVWFSK